MFELMLVCQLVFDPLKMADYSGGSNTYISGNISVEVITQVKKCTAHYSLLLLKVKQYVSTLLVMLLCHYCYSPTHQHKPLS